MSVPAVENKKGDAKPHYPRVAELWEKNPKGGLKCNLCARHCVIADGKRGFCGTRENVKETLYAVNYGKACSLAIDPIEKKPLYHFHPGSRALSVATLGCNFRCKFCCNWQISQADFGILSEDDVSPERIVEIAKREKVEVISYTYTEPTVFFEYAYDTAKLAKKEGLLNTFVTNGYSTPEMIKMISPYLDAATVDFKGSGNPEFYKEFCSVQKVEPIYDALLAYKREKVFVEITDLLVPGPNGSSMADVEKLCRWIVENLGGLTPIHFLRFFPSNRMMDAESTPDKTLKDALEVAKKEGLKYVYAGNVPWEQDTCCPKCGATLIKRDYFFASEVKLKKDGACPKCGTKAENIIL